MERTSIEMIPEIFDAALRAVSPYEIVRDHCCYIEELYKRGEFGRIVVVGAGKAACPMARAIEDHLQIPIDAGIVVTRYAYCPERPRRIEVIEAGHPIPDENGSKGTNAILGLLHNADERTLVVCLISGGGSALLVSPAEGVSLDEKQKVTELLLKAGADIHDLNTVRKHISNVKGGRLAAIAYPAKVVSLILSDVIGDRLDVIASGPTAPDTTTYGDAIRVLELFGLMGRSPRNIVDVLKKGARGLMPETPKKESLIFKNVENLIIGNNKRALDAAGKKAAELDLSAEIISPEITGEASEAGRGLAKVAIEIRKVSRRDSGKRVCLISGGETTVTVRGDGTGGRNMELALSFAIATEGAAGLTILSAGTDGTDGPTDAAGAIADFQTIRTARDLGLVPEEYLGNNDSYNFFRKTGGLFVTGPTGTNVMDVQIIVVE